MKITILCLALVAAFSVSACATKHDGTCCKKSDKMKKENAAAQNNDKAKQKSPM